jgi:hypothetical protein
MYYRSNTLSNYKQLPEVIQQVITNRLAEQNQQVFKEAFKKYELTKDEKNLLSEYENLLGHKHQQLQRLKREHKIYCNSVCYPLNETETLRQIRLVRSEIQTIKAKFKNYKQSIGCLLLKSALCGLESY